MKKTLTGTSFKPTPRKDVEKRKAVGYYVDKWKLNTLQKEVLNCGWNTLNGTI